MHSLLGDVIYTRKIFLYTPSPFSFPFYPCTCQKLLSISECSNGMVGGLGKRKSNIKMEIVGGGERMEMVEWWLV